MDNEYYDEPSARDGPLAIGKKRKSSGDDAESGLAEATSRGLGHGPKKIKLPASHAEQGTMSVSPPGTLPGQDRSLLPQEIWHCVFTYCPPKSLGSLLSVNKRFNAYLDPTLPVRANLSSVTQGVLKLMEPNAIWQASRRRFWPQMPAPLRSSSELDMWRLACSPRCQDCGKVHARGPTSRNPLHPGPGTEGVAVIWAFGTRMCSACLLKASDKELDLQISPSIPSAIIPALPFVFFTQDCDIFTATMFEANQIPANLEVTKLFSKSDAQALQAEFLQVKDMGQGTVNEWLKGLPGRGSDLQQDASKWEKWESSGGLAKMRSLLYPGYKTQKSSTNPIPATMSSLGRQERTAEQAAELKAARKAEIERRASLLNPPLTAEVLAHTLAFQAATQIVAELDDGAWERLKPRLLAQRADAEKMLQSERKTEPTCKQEFEGQSPLETTTLATNKEARDRIDKQWEVTQAPLRAKIAGYADEVIRDSWDEGEKITRESCSRFAVDSLIYVRTRFYAEVAKDAAAAKAAGKSLPLDPPEGPFTQKLTLENMKWIFDAKFKPYTEPLRKEIFYCNGCEGNYKAFGFEGVIQHYAAKHTSALSLGSIVVHWRAEWPEHPPFSATARSGKGSLHPRAPGGFAVNGGAPFPPNHVYQAPGTAPGPPGPSYPYGYIPPTYSGHYPQLQPPPPQPYQPQPAAAAPFVLATSYEQQPSYAAPSTFHPVYQAAGFPYTNPPVEISLGPAPSGSGHYDYHYGSYQANGVVGQHIPSQPSTYPSLGQIQVDDIARNSREVWRALGDIRNLPGNVRVFVTIHHLVKRFRYRFYETPPLAMFIDGLSHNKEMRPVRNVNGLVCKACHLGLGNAVSVEQDRKDFSLPQLANHFQSKHIEPMQRLQTAAAPLDWVIDMVLIPDLAILPSIASSANEPQKALLSAAFPAVFDSQDGQISSEPRPTSTTDAQEGPLVASNYSGYSSAMGSAGANHFVGYRASGESTRSTVPKPLSENERPVTHSDSGRNSPSYGSQLNRGESGSHDGEEAAGENRDGRSQNRHDSDEWAPGNKSGKSFSKNQGAKKGLSKKKSLGERKMLGRQKKLKAKENKAREQQKAREGRAVHEGKDVHGGEGAATQDQSLTQSGARASHQLERSYLAPPTDKERESGVMAGEESYVDQRPLPQAQGQQVDSASYPEMPPKYQTYQGGQDQHGDREARARFFAASGRRSPGEADPVYYSRPATVESVQDTYGLQRNQAGYREPLPRHTQGEWFGPPASRAEDTSHGTPLPETDHRRYRDDGYMAHRAPVEAYEIVHVIDEHGEYYIRRPARRVPGPRYLYDEPAAPHNAGPYVTHTQAPRPGLVPEVYRASAAPENRPVNRRADPAYFEEYDPRFPAA
ncbi:hypothetical protein CHGG_00744 [Chaetomium globosum CBS 148.51]|uniref:F-box domain-containing protein n=1 Tax=Chaetomium globosum (strain ATCC 6205 / CBS 148.51 / DSM 1962 / NBRC 6347 / NRRL 1970) TaxID=306901 RepID=Q2HGB0_CHAGB|nr:uncharacterized protein CHGG_00744 [Chaetomium globosum CBS 148.51]EAQ92509.1 hypothetical protein CHGG_00744 [Chaetomium globosum CBS 148.51]